MPVSIFDDVRGQYLDNYGKTRMLNYATVSLMTPPLPPMEKDLVTLSEVKRADRDELDEFIFEREMTIISQEIVKGRVRGVWVEQEKENLIGGYIPTANIKRMEEIDEAPLGQTNPLQAEESSLLDDMRNNEKTALFLKQYVLFEYSRKLKDSTDLTQKDFVIDPSHIYDFNSLDKKLIPDNDVIYRDGKIIVTSKAMRDKLLSFLRTELFNHPVVVETFSDRTNIDGYYSSLPDFRKSHGQILFFSLKGLREWYDRSLSESSYNDIRYTLLENTIEPFFYRGVIGQGKLFLVQNVRGSLEDALKVAEIWEKNKYNIGSDPGDVILEGEEYILYRENGLREGSGFISILIYDSGNYAALLPIEKE